MLRVITGSDGIMCDLPNRRVRKGGGKKGDTQGTKIMWGKKQANGKHKGERVLKKKKKKITWATEAQMVV